MAPAPVYMPPPAPMAPMAAPMPMPMPMPAPPIPVAPIMEKPHHDHIHLHTSYKHTAIFVPEPIHHVPYYPPVAVPFTSTASILVLFILLLIITRSIWR